MYIKNIVLDGFKSYGRRTEVPAFDPEFNAITGLNGTGKSNILDSICFVLGISNLGQVRATSLQDLVYKSGQAGISRATVTVTFDNSDESQYPIGYERCHEISVTRQVVVGGKNKYLINGKNVVNKKVQDLFCSVQLNVNNPNFLIMQGRVTKVLNMKPVEILSMIEEAAGTSMYESKKDISLKMLEKKESKLKEMTSLLVEEIEPKLVKLRRERAVYVQYQQMCSDIDYLQRIHISYRFLQLQESLKNCKNNIEKIQNKITNDSDKIKANEEEMKVLEAEIVESQAALDEESGGRLHELEDALKALSKADAQTTAHRKSGQETLDAEKRKMKTLVKSIKDDESTLVTKENDMTKVVGMFENLKQAFEGDEKAMADAEKRFEAVSYGLSTNDEGEAMSLQDQLMNARGKITQATTTITQHEMEIKELSNMLKSKTRESQTNDSAYVKDKSKLTVVQNEVTRLQNELGRMSYQEGHLERLHEQQLNLNQECRGLKRNLDNKGGHRFEFNYQDPEPNFDRRKVKGMVCNLFNVKDPKYYMGLSTAAGGSLYNVVCDTEETGKLILQRGQLQTRATLIPINKISSGMIDQSKVRFAQELVGAENVVSALSLINYSSEFEPVMRNVFGWVLICKDLETAKKVTYHPRVMCRCVTLDGDVVDPSGTLSGGSAPKGGAVLEEVAELQYLRRELNAKETEYKRIGAEKANVEQLANRFNNMKESLELKTLELKNVQQSLAQTSFHQHQQEIEDLKVRLETLRKEIADAKTLQSTEKTKVLDIESKLKDAKGHRERELKKAEDDLKKFKKKSEESRKVWKKREQEYETLKLEIEEIKKSIITSNEQLEALKISIASLEENMTAFIESCKKSSSEVDKIKADIKQQKDKINSQHRELKDKNSKRNKLNSANQDLTLNIKKQENEITTIKSENKDALNKLNNLENQYDWIATDKDQFGAHNSRYDYAKQDPTDAGKKLSSLQEKKEKMGRNINQKAMALLQQQEEQFQNVSSRIKTVEDDREKIIKIINGFDEKKKVALKKAWQVVNENFGSIFSTLLPGANSKLEPPEGIEYYQGLEVKVSFNNLWKDTLTELSGGQRSLVALSLILAMLKFKPAPLYILDEVDAALDLSHTQNIGAMLKAHFKKSQFIVVSLKEGMFNNANVLFQTKFIDGMSGVIRNENLANKRK